MKMFIAFKMAYSCCFGCRGNLDFPEFLQRKFFNINYRMWSVLLSTLNIFKTLFTFEWATPAYFYFRYFQQQSYSKNFRLQQDSNSDQHIWRHDRWPLDHHHHLHGPQNPIDGCEGENSHFLQRTTSNSLLLVAASYAKHGLNEPLCGKLSLLCLVYDLHELVQWKLWYSRRSLPSYLPNFKFNLI